MSKALTCLAAGLLAVARQLSPPAPVSAQGYESPPTFSAAKVLPPELLQSPYHKIVGPVTVQGFLNRYQMQTKYGTFTVEGTELLRMRVREVAATAELEKVNTAETLVASAGRTALKPVETAKDLVTAPGKTVGEAWKGVGGWFNRVDASMSATDPNREGTVASLTGGSKARRKLAYDLGVDPYTTFEPLNAELTRVASASAVGETGVNIGLAFVTGGAGIAISVGGTTSTVREVLRDKTAAELEQLGREKLAAMGVSPGTVNAFYATGGLTPTDKAVIVASLMTLGAAGDREVFIARTAQAQTYAEGFAYRRKAELTAAFAKRVSPVRSFFNVNGTPVMQTGPASSPSCPWTMSIGARVSRSSFPTPGRKDRSGSPAARASSPPTPWPAAAGRSCPRPARVWRNNPLTSREMAMPQGALPTGIDLITLSVGTSITETSLLLPLVVNSNFSSGVKASCQTLWPTSRYFSTSSFLASMTAT